MTATTQRNAVSEGMALGLVMARVNELTELTELTEHKTSIDLAFERVFPKCAYAHEFPQVLTDLGNGTDGWGVITRAGYRKQTFHLYWESTYGDGLIRARPQWQSGDIDPHVVANSIHEDIPASGWHDLAVDYLRRPSSTSV